MRPSRCCSAAVVLGLALSLAGSALAGAAPARKPARSSSADVFAGYSYTHAGEAGLNGWGLSGAYPFRGGPLHLVADVSGQYGSYAGADVGQFGAFLGARWCFSAGPLRPFGEGLVGAVRTSYDVASVSDADVDWGLAFGGGADYALGKRWAVRGLIHLRLLQGEGTWDTDPRLALGVVYRLGR